MGQGNLFYDLYSKKKKERKQQYEITDTGIYGKIPPAGNTGTQWQREELRYLLFSNAVEGQLFLHSVASVDHQTGVCRAEGSEAGRRAVILQHKKKGWKNIRCVLVNLQHKAFF